MLLGAAAASIELPALRSVGRNRIFARRHDASAPAPSGPATGKAPKGRLRRIPSATTTSVPSPRSHAVVSPRTIRLAAELLGRIDRRSWVAPHLIEVAGRRFDPGAFAQRRPGDRLARHHPQSTLAVAQLVNEHGLTWLQCLLNFCDGRRQLPRKRRQLPGGQLRLRQVDLRAQQADSRRKTAIMSTRGFCWSRSVASRWRFAESWASSAAEIARRSSVRAVGEAAKSCSARSPIRPTASSAASLSRSFVVRIRGTIRQRRAALTQRLCSFRPAARRSRAGRHSTARSRCDS